MRRGRLVFGVVAVAFLILVIVTARSTDRIGQWLLKLHGGH